MLETAPRSTDASSTAKAPSGAGIFISIACDSIGVIDPGRRKFRTPSNLYFGYFVYNAQQDKTTRQPKLIATTRLVRDGKIVFEGEPTPVNTTGQTDLQRIIAGSGVQLGTEMTPGEYILQITVTDQLAKEKEATQTQWVDFEIVK